MNRMLASVNSLAEAELALACGVDIIDLKQPAQGALGALETSTITTIVTQIAGRCPLSATIGDLPLQAEVILPAVTRMAATGVQYVKIGFFPDGDQRSLIEHLRPIAAQGTQLIAVLFADAAADFSLLPALYAAGFTGVMLDTMHKQHGSLLQLLSTTQLREFVTQAKARGLLSGLAGSLRLQDIADLLPLEPDYLGFRGALCNAQQRTNGIDSKAMHVVRQALRNS